MYAKMLFVGLCHLPRYIVMIPPCDTNGSCHYIDDIAHYKVVVETQIYLFNHIKQKCHMRT